MSRFLGDDASYSPCKLSSALTIFYPPRMGKEDISAVSGEGVTREYLARFVHAIVRKYMGFFQVVEFSKKTTTAIIQ